MNHILAIVCAIWLQCVAVNAGDQKALIFNRVTRIAIDLPNNKNSKGNCEAWATACPLMETTFADKTFIQKHSITKKPLFVQNTYDERDPISEVEKHICESPFQMTVAYNLMNFSVEFGYEVFYKSEDSDKYFNCLYENYHSIEKTTRAMKSLLKTGIFTLGNLADRLKKAFVDDFGSLWYNNNWKMKLIWIPMFKVKYSFSKMISSVLTYEIRRNHRWPVTDQCKDYSLGSEVYQGKKVDQLYNEQVKIFKKFKLPLKPCAPEDDSCEIRCDSNNTCLEKWSLIPLDQFHLFPNSPLYCSHMVTVPIWRNVSKEVLQKLDQYLYALFRILDTPLQIISGTKDQLTLPKKKKLSLSNNTVFLDPKNKKIPAPKIIYKIIKYNLPRCEPSPNVICEYSAIIVVHNDPNFESKDALCINDEEITKKWGWDAITKNSDGTDRRNVYVCPENKATLKAIYGRFSLKKPDLSIGDLDLSKFPDLKKDGTVGEKNIIEDVDAKFEQLLEKGDADFEYYQYDVEELSAGNLDDLENISIPEDFEDHDSISDSNFEKR